MASEQDRWPGLSPTWQRGFAWVERELGGRITSFERQERWRPAWFLELERDGETLPLYWRGERGETDHGVYALEHEMVVLQVLGAQGLPVPLIYGLCDDPRGILMQRCPGRANLATATSDAEREAVLDHYMELLAQMHGLDVGLFEAVGLERPKSSEALGLGDFDAWEATFRRQKRRPEPLVEFGIRWLRRNAPVHREQVSFLACDSGQFLFDAGRVTALLDFELAYLGDPAADLAGMRCRDLSEPLGDLSRGFARYAALTGSPLDLPVIDYHTARFGLVTPLAVAHLCADPPPGVNLAQYLSWYLVYGRVAIELIARLTQTPLEPPSLPDDRPTRHSVGHRSLVSQLQAAEGYETDAALRMALYLERVDRLGPALEAEDLDEVAALLGHRPSSWLVADAELEELVAAAGPERDGELARYFYRRSLRHEALLLPAMRELEHAQLQPIG